MDLGKDQYPTVHMKGYGECSYCLLIKAYNLFIKLGYTIIGLYKEVLYHTPGRGILKIGHPRPNIFKSPDAGNHLHKNKHVCTYGSGLLASPCFYFVLQMFSLIKTQEQKGMHRKYAQIEWGWIS